MMFQITYQLPNSIINFTIMVEATDYFDAQKAAKEKYSYEIINIAQL